MGNPSLATTSQEQETKEFSGGMAAGEALEGFGEMSTTQLPKRGKLGDMAENGGVENGNRSDEAL